MDLIRDLAPTVRILAIQSSVTRGIWAQRLSGRDKKWLRPFVSGSSKCQSPDLRKESGLCVFRFTKFLPRSEGPYRQRYGCS